ncbi:MAG TPA: PepSY1/2 domain-containing protein, partial [Bacilli bacterium]
VYPEKLMVRIALDDGDVVGLLAADYLQEHKPRNNIAAPAMTIEKARETLNPELKVSNHDIALIKNELEKEVICHEFSGRINGTRYRIYINGVTGIEEKVEVIDQADPSAARG